MRSKRLLTFWLLSAAAVGGAVGMAVELLGARLLGVAFGGSLIVWAAMISVTLLSLACGYFVGGWLADRAPRPGLLALVLLLIGVLVAACPHARFILKTCYDSMGIRGGALASSAIIFFLPLGLLGVVSPFVIRLLSDAGRGVGVTAGGVYAVSTLGSVAGTLLTGLWLIPQFGTPAGFRLAAVVIAATGAAGLLAAAGWKGALAAAVPVALWFVPQAADKIGATYIAPDGERVTVEAACDSPHGHIVVLQKGNYELLVVNGIVQTGVPKDLGRLARGQMLASNYFQELVPYMTDDPAKARVLVIGLAGGMTATLLKLYDMDVESVDLDERIIQVARKYFGFTGPAVVADGRMFLEASPPARYDFCIMDTYSGDVFPFHLASVEAFAAAKRVLTPGGTLVINYIGSPAGRAFACLYLTVGKAFAHVRAIRGEFGDDVQTITLFASDKPIAFNKGWLENAGGGYGGGGYGGAGGSGGGGGYGGGFAGVDPISDTIDRLTCTPTRPDAFVLTDEYNPIDFLRGNEAVRWRQRTAANIGEAGIF